MYSKFPILLYITLEGIEAIGFPTFGLLVYGPRDQRIQVRAALYCMATRYTPEFYSGQRASF